MLPDINVLNTHFNCYILMIIASHLISISLDGANPDEIEGEGESSGSNPGSPHKKQRKESSGSSDLASPINVPPQHFGVPPFTTGETTMHALTMEV